MNTRLLLLLSISIFVCNFCLSQLGMKNIPSSVQSFQFVENKGQWDENILFKTEIPSGYLYLTREGLVYTLYDQKKKTFLEQQRHQNYIIDSSNQFLNFHTYKVNFVNKNELSQLVGKSPYPTIFNYYLDKNLSKWASNVKGYFEVEYQNIWKGIDMRIYQFNSTIKYEFIVHPLADPNEIKLEYEGLNNISITDDGKLKLNTDLMTIYDHKPFSYQKINGLEKSIPSKYKLSNTTQSFKVGEYNRHKKLIIDPQLIFSTYSGSTADNWGNTACLDKEGNLYTGGIVFPTPQNGFPTTIGAYQSSFQAGDIDIGLLKFDSSGVNLLSATYVGGSDSEIPLSLVYDERNQELIVLAITGSKNLPVSNNAYQTQFGGGSPIDGSYRSCNSRDKGPMVGGYAFENGTDILVFKLSNDFTQLRAATYLGGADNDGVLYQFNPLVNNYGDQLRGDINVDEDGNIYIASVTKSFNFPVKNASNSSYLGGEFDGIVAKLNQDLSEAFWVTYLGGSSSDMAFSVQFDQFKNVLVSGGTTSTDYPTTTNAYQQNHAGSVDAFITRLDRNDNSIIHSTFSGGLKFDQAYFLQQDENFNPYILGQTKNTLPIIPKNAFHIDNTGIFIQKFNYELSELTYSTTIGSQNSNSNNIIPNISPTAFLVNDCGQIFISGWGGRTNSTSIFLQGCIGPLPTGYNGGDTRNLPLTNNAFQKTTDGSDFYFASIDQFSHKLLYATYFGGPVSAEHVDGGTSRFDKRGIIYQSVCAGCGSNQDFPLSPSVDNNPSTYPKRNGSNNCNNGVIKFDLASLESEISSEDVCIEEVITLQNNSIGGELFIWDFGDGTTLTTSINSTVTHSYNNLGTYTVSLTVIDDATCKKSDSSTFNIVVYEPKPSFHTLDTLCLEDEKQISIPIYEDDSLYSWSPTIGLSNSTIPDPVVTGLETIRYFVEIIDTNSCDRTDTVDIFVPMLSDEFNFRIVNSCNSNKRPTLQILSVGSTNSDETNYLWGFGDGDSSTNRLPYHTYQNDGTYTISFLTSVANCSLDTSLDVTINTVEISNIITPNGDGKNDVFTIKNSGTNQDNFWKLDLYNRWGKRVYSNSDYRNDYDATDLEDGTYYYLITSPDGSKCKNWVQITR